MKPVDQTILGENGNCLQACIASLFELPIEAVPQFPISGQFLALEKWLKQYDLQPVALDISQSFVPYDTYYLLWGVSPRGIRHSVIVAGGKMVHDPHPDRSGIETPESVVYLVRKFQGTETVEQAG